MSGGDRQLSKVATPTNHLAVVGNFVGALLGAKMGLREVPIFFFAVGVVHYVVLFVRSSPRSSTRSSSSSSLRPASPPSAGRGSAATSTTPPRSSTSPPSSSTCHWYVYIYRLLFSS